MNLFHSINPWVVGAFVFLLFSCTTNESMIGESPVATVRIQYQRVMYGNLSLQFGDLRVPVGLGQVPVIMIIHGGCWRSQYTLELMDSMAVDLAERGYATWNIEYRRTEDEGGGWPGTFLDVANALKHLEMIAEDHPIDLQRIYLTGHSAGGHLALWLGGQDRIRAGSAIKVNDLPAIQGIVSLAGITDLKTYYRPSGCGSNVRKLMGGLADAFPGRYDDASPIELLPFQIRLRLINGEEDDIVPLDHVRPYAKKAEDAAVDVKIIPIPDADHFDVITPGSIAWDRIIEVFDALIRA